jgi:hypothetical protein
MKNLHAKFPELSRHTLNWPLRPGEIAERNTLMRNSHVISTRL